MKDKANPKFDIKYYVDAMDYWHGRVDSEDDYDTFRWHQWVEKLDLNEENKPFKGRVAFGIIGFCSEQGVERNKGRVGTALAPDFIRRQMSNLPCSFSQKVKIYDAGNIICYDISMEEGQKMLGEAVESMIALNLFPIVLGGGHETTFGHFQGQFNSLKKKGKKPDIGIVNFDAHFDLRPYDNGSSSGSMFRQIYDMCEKEECKYGYLPLGIQQHSNTVSLFKTAQEMKIDYVLARKFQYGSIASIYEKIDMFMYHHKSAYITICTDVFSSAFAPGVSATQSLGLDPEVVIPIIKHIIRTRKVRGFDICEISPRFDQDDTTANLGAVIIFSVVNTLCKLHGLGQTWYEGFGLNDE